MWEEKFGKNVARDARNQRELQELGWRVVVLWECEIRKEPGGVVTELAEQLWSRPKDEGERMKAKG